MKFAVIGGSGLIGSRVVEKLNAGGHDAVAVSRSTGVDVVSGEGLQAAVADVDVVIDVTNSPTADGAAIAFFQTSTDNLLAASGKAGVGHYVVLSMVGADRVPQQDYSRAKVRQENVLKAGPIPYSIVRATQFMEFVDAILDWTTEGDVVRLPPTLVQPIAAADVAAAVALVAAGSPLNGALDIAGPDVYRLDELGRLTLASRHDGRRVVTDDGAGMFAGIDGDALIARDGARIAATRYVDWLG